MRIFSLLAILAHPIDSYVIRKLLGIWNPRLRTSVARENYAALNYAWPRSNARIRGIMRCESDPVTSKRDWLWQKTEDKNFQVLFWDFSFSFVFNYCFCKIITTPYVRWFCKICFSTVVHSAVARNTFKVTANRTFTEDIW